MGPNSRCTGPACSAPGSCSPGAAQLRDTLVTGAPLRFPPISWEEGKFLLFELPRVVLCQGGSGLLPLPLGQQAGFAPLRGSSERPVPPENTARMMV